MLNFGPGSADTSAVAPRPASRRQPARLPGGLVATALVALLVGSGGPEPFRGVSTWPGAGGPVIAGRQLTASVTGSSGAGSVGGPGAYEGQPTDAEIKAAEDAAAMAHGRVDRQAGQVEAARATLRDAASRAGLALERYRSAVLALQQAQFAADAAQDRLQGASRELQTRQEDLAGWVRQAYGSGGMLARSPTMATLLSGASLDELDLTVVVLRRSGEAAQRTLARVEQAQAAQQAAADAADAAQQAAQASAGTAARLRDDADAAVKTQQAAVDQLENDLAGARSAAAAADARAARLARARVLAEAGARAYRNRVTGEVGSCAGGDVSAYGNGNIPLTALCPLWGAPGEYLRADAMYAFGRISQAYAAEFGTPICVTDSYRSYQEQVQVYAEKPQLAAVPGTSRHGWGTAVDLCGGVESFGTATHEWMLENAPGFGWFHPAWAEPDGSRPEAWHWEFAG
jgi:hypothetical protein